MPALIYLIFSFTHVIIDTYKGLYNTAMIELWISLLFTLLLNLLCEQDLGIISWIIISIPFLLMSVIAGLILFVLKLNPATGQKLPQNTPQSTESTQAPSRHAFPIDVFYGSLANSKPPEPTR